MRILIIDDNRHVTDSLRKGLKSSFAVDIALTGKQGLILAESVSYDALLLDLNLPDIPGHDLCKLLRSKDVSAPIIVVTGRDIVRDKVQLLDYGADDYMTKPFSLDELKARLRAAIRHAPTKQFNSILRCGDIELDSTTRGVKRGDNSIELRRKEFDLLEYLIRNRGRVVTRSMIMEHLWDMNENLWANVVDVHIKHLRDKVDRPFNTKYIKTVHGVGYKLDLT